MDRTGPRSRKLPCTYARVQKSIFSFKPDYILGLGVHVLYDREELKPVRIPDTTLAFMFESAYLFSLTEFAENENLDQEYYKCWQPLDKHFSP